MRLCTQDRSVSETPVCRLCLGMTNYLAPAGREQLALRPGARFPGGPSQAPSIREHKGAPVAPELMTTGPRLRRSERSMKPPPHRSLNRGAVSPAFAAFATRPVSASAWIARRTASTTCGSAFASHSRRHASSCTFNDIERHRTTEAAPGAFLIPADLRRHCRGNIVYSERE